MIPRIPRWQSYVAQTTQPMFTPKQCQMIIDAGHAQKPEQARVGGGKKGGEKKGRKGGKGRAKGGKGSKCRGCFNCGGQHPIKQCTKPRQCRICGAQDHISPSCPKKKSAPLQQAVRYTKGKGKGKGKRYTPNQGYQGSFKSGILKKGPPNAMISKKPLISNPKSPLTSRMGKCKSKDLKGAIGNPFQKVKEKKNENM